MNTETERTIVNAYKVEPMASARKILLLFAIPLAALALTASSASAAIVITQEPGGTACPSLTVTGHVVSGGCHAAVSSTAAVTMLAHTGAAEVVISSCNVAGEARGQTNGTGYVVEQMLTDSGSPGSCTRRPCDEAAGAMPNLPWPAAIEDAGATTTAELTFCLRTAASGEGGAGTFCTVHRQGSDQGNHNYTSVVSEVACESLPSIELVGNLVTFFDGAERAEVVNN